MLQRLCTCSTYRTGVIRGFIKFRWEGGGGGVCKRFSRFYSSSHQSISQRDVGPIASQEVFVPEFLRKPIAACDFTGRGPNSLRPTSSLDLPMCVTT